MMTAPSAMNSPAVRRTLSWAITAPDFERWLIAADVGAELVYAGGPVVPHGMPVVAAVAEAKDAGEVRTHQRKVNGSWEYFAVRRRPDVAARPGRSTRDAIAPESVKGRMLEALRLAASSARPCPTNSEFARAFGLRDAEAARYEFNQLVAMGRIMVVNCGPRQRRVVTIISSGKSTARGTL